MRKLSGLLLAAAFVLSAGAAEAQDWHHGHDGHGPGGGHWWHGGDIHSFYAHDYGYWRGGSWFHGAHGGRDGWWWTVGGVWYYYPAPVYPYPDPYMPPGVVVQPGPVTPVGVAPSTVYYCANPAGYYPYVPECLAAWQPVAAAASAAPAPVVAQPPVLAPAPVVLPSSVATRDSDDRALNALGAEYQGVNLQLRGARTKLKNLEKKVEAFRQALYTRPYNVMDIIRDADNLEHRIAEQREKLPAIVRTGTTPMEIEPLPGSPPVAQPVAPTMPYPPQ